MPSFAISPSDFWNRWHISLSTWLRDYLYVPLGGNREGHLNTYRNLALTMLLGGLWHGAAWTFVVWGAFHGAILIIYRRWPALSGPRPPFQPSGHSIAAERAKTWFRMLLMFHLVCFSWLLFRAESMAQVGTMMRAVAGDFSPTPFSSFALTMLAFFALPLTAYEASLERQDNQLIILGRSVWLQALVMFICMFICMFILIVFPPLQQQSFIYFQF